MEGLQGPDFFPICKHRRRHHLRFVADQPGAVVPANLFLKRGPANLFFLLMKERRKKAETRMAEGKPIPSLGNPALAQQNCLNPGTKSFTNQRPFFVTNGQKSSFLFLMK